MDCERHWESNKRPLGANLVGCHGAGVQALARQNLGEFRAVWMRALKETPRVSGFERRR